MVPQSPQMPQGGGESPDQGGKCGCRARDPEAYVNFSASGMPLVRLVELFDDFFPGQILMPVSKMQEKVTTDEELRQIMLGDLGEYLGLVPVRTPLPGLATPPTDAEVRKPL